MSEPFVTIATFPQLMSAEMARGILRSQGIPTKILHPNSGSLWGDAVGGIGVRVPESQARRAVFLLEEPDDDAVDERSPAA